VEKPVSPYVSAVNAVVIPPLPAEITDQGTGSKASSLDEKPRLKVLDCGLTGLELAAVGAIMRTPRVTAGTIVLRDIHFSSFIYHSCFLRTVSPIVS
jgi:hypothetical protein